MKTKLNKILAFMLSVCIMLLLVSCDKKQDAEGKMTLVLAGEQPLVYEVELDGLEIKNGLISVLDYLKSENKLDYAETAGYLDKVGPLENNAAEGKYIYIYTSVMADMDVSQYAMAVEYEGKILTSTGVGAKDMHIEDGCVIYIGYIIW